MSDAAAGLAAPIEEPWLSTKAASARRARSPVTGEGPFSPAS